MDKVVSEFLSDGTIHSTQRSHRAAAKGYFQFLLQETKSKHIDRIKFTRPQLKALHN